MTNLEKGLTRRSLLGNSLRTAGGILLLGGTSKLLSSCAIDVNENKHYRFDLSRLDSWQADLFLKAGEDYWGVQDGRDDSSRNKVYFGNVPEGKIAHAFWSYRYSNCDLDLLDFLKREAKCEKVYTFTIKFKHDANWVDCNKGETGVDFYNFVGHELGHIVNLRGNEMHSNDPTDIMYNPVPQRC